MTADTVVVDIFCVRRHEAR